jgi:tetratricopeptide (TPR) repeat protein
MQPSRCICLLLIVIGAVIACAATCKCLDALSNNRAQLISCEAGQDIEDMDSTPDSICERSSKIDRNDAAMLIACDSFDTYQKASDLPGMRLSLSRMMQSCQSGGGLRTPSVIREKFVSAVQMRIQNLLRQATNRGDDPHWRAMIRSELLQTAIQKCVVVAESRAACDLVFVWMGCLGGYREQDPLLELDRQRMQSIALAYLARLDMESERFSESELEYRAAMELSQNLADRAFSNRPELERLLQERRINTVSQADPLNASEDEDLDPSMPTLLRCSFIADKAYSELGLATLYCREGKLESAESEYLQAVKLPTGFWCQTLSGLVTYLAERYEQRGDLVKAREHFTKIQDFYGSHWSYPAPDKSYEDAVLGHIPAQETCVDRCIKFMTKHPSSKDAQVIRFFNEFKVSIAQENRAELCSAGLRCTKGYCAVGR